MGHNPNVTFWPLKKKSPLPKAEGYFFKNKQKQQQAR